MCALVSRASDDSTSNFRVIALTLKRIDRKEWCVEAKFACNAYDELRERNDEREREREREREVKIMSV
jgi:hypothetical protein